MNHPQVHNGDIDDDDHPIHKTYHFHNCETVYLHSLNTHSTTMQDCGNKVTYHRPKFTDYGQNHKVLVHSQSHELLFDGPQTTSTGPPPNPYIYDPSLPSIPTPAQHAPPKSEITNSDVLLQKNVQSLRPTSPPHCADGYTHHDLKYLEQLLESSLATAAVIQFSGNTLSDILTPRAYDTFKALRALSALDISNSKPRVGGIPDRSAAFGIRNDLSNLDPSPLPNFSHAVPRTCRIHISISVDYVMLFLWTGFVAISCLAFFMVETQLCDIVERM